MLWRDEKVSLILLLKLLTQDTYKDVLVKSMEDLKVAHDYTVRSSNNDIVQFCYGYDGFNSVDLEKQKTNFTKD